MVLCTWNIPCSELVLFCFVSFSCKLFMRGSIEEPFDFAKLLSLSFVYCIFLKRSVSFLYFLGLDEKFFGACWLRSSCSVFFVLLPTLIRNLSRRRSLGFFGGDIFLNYLIPKFIYVFVVESLLEASESQLRALRRHRRASQAEHLLSQVW